MSGTGVQQAGVLVARDLVSSSVYLDPSCSSTPVLNLAHQFAGGSISLSAGQNPNASFSVTPVAAGNTQLFSGPNAQFQNTLSVPGTVSIGVANVANALNVIGPTVLAGNTAITGSLTANGSALVTNVLQVGSTVNAPTIHANVITATGPTANCYIETTSAVAGNTAGLYLGGGWDIKVLSGGQLAFQSLLNGQRVNSFVINPSGVAVTAGQVVGSVN